MDELKPAERYAMELQTWQAEHKRLTQLETKRQVEGRLSPDEYMEIVVLQESLSDTQKRLDTVESEMKKATLSFDVDTLIAGWGDEEKRQQYEGFYAAILQARMYAKNIVALTHQQCMALANVGLSPSDFNIDAGSVLRNLASQQPNAVSWDWILTNAGGILPLNPIEQTMDVDPGTKPLTRRMFLRVLGNVA